jgi:aminoglycoside 3-N-acetyltransferase
LSVLHRRSRARKSPESERELLDKLPAFDAATARSARDNGTLVEFLRTFPGSSVNDHVARFVVWGKHAEHLISGQPWNYAFGHGSLLERFVNLDGRILLLGCDHDTVTFLHYAEHIVDIPDKRISRFKVPINENGIRLWNDMEEFDTSERAHANWPDRFFARLVDTYLARTSNRGGLVGDAQCFLLDSGGLLEFGLSVMRAVAADPGAADVLVPVDLLPMSRHF